MTVVEIPFPSTTVEPAAMKPWPATRFAEPACRRRQVAPDDGEDRVAPPAEPSSWPRIFPGL